MVEMKIFRNNILKHYIKKAYTIHDRYQLYIWLNIYI